MDGTEVIEPLEERLIGRYARKAIKHPETKEVIVPENGLITEDLAVEIVSANIEEVRIRSAFTCNTRHGVCKKCYGRNLQQVKKLKWEKQLVLSLLNQSGNQVHS